MHEAPARILPRSLVEVDCHVVIRQVGIVDAIGRDVFPLCPLAAQLEDLVETIGELLRGDIVDEKLPVPHRHPRTPLLVRRQVEERDVAACGTVHAGITPRALHAQIGVCIRPLCEHDSGIENPGGEQVGCELRVPCGAHRFGKFRTIEQAAREQGVTRGASGKLLVHDLPIDIKTDERDDGGRLGARPRAC